MTKETMNMHRALSELKVLDKKIYQSINGSTFCNGIKHSCEKINGVTLKEHSESLRGNYNKVVDLIARRNALKRAIVLSNAVTKVMIAGREYTVAEAIEMKNHGIELEKNFLDELISQYDRVQKILETKNGEELEKRTETHIKTLFGERENKDIDVVERAKTEFEKSQRFDFIDPIKIKDRIDNLQKKIDSFTSEVDSVLSVSNAITEITFEY